MSKEKTVRQACFLCTTSFQIWGAVSLQLANRLKADIIVFDDLNGYREIAEGLQQTGLFENVIPVDFYGSLKNKKDNRPAIIRRMLTAERYVSRWIDKQTVYESLYTSSAAVSKSVFMRVLTKRLDRVGIVIYDDGIGSYQEKGRIKKGSQKFQRVKKMLGWQELLQNPDRILLYEPELYQAEDGVRVEPMPKIALTPENKAVLRRIFGEEEENLQFPQQVVLFDTFRLPNRKKEEEDRLDQVFCGIAEICGEDRVILKEHPRSLARSRAEVARLSRAGVPMELLYAHQEDLQDKILVALNSTALFSPKMLFDKEPYLVLLYKLTSDDPAVREKRDALYGKLTGMYSRADRILIPETEDELREFLKSRLKDTE